LELKDIQAGVHSALNQLQKQTQLVQSGLENLKADEANLRLKIEKKKAEVDRTEKRLKSLKGVRPPYMDEFERVEEELKRVYNRYVERLRILSYLEHLMDEHQVQESHRMEETNLNIKKMQNKFQKEELKMLRGENEEEDSDEDIQEIEVSKESFADEPLSEEEDDFSGEDDF
jgi:clusterin-associated protein 1